MNNNSYIQKNNVFAGVNFAFLVIFYVILNFIIGFVLNSTLKQGTAIYQSCAMLISTIALLTCLLISKKVKKQKMVELFRVKKFNFTYLVFPLLISFGMFFGLGKANDWFIGILSKIGLKVGDVSLSINGVGEYILFIFTACLLPALLEECFFRGILLFSLKSSGKIFAVFVSAICFSLYHLNFAQFLYQFIYGAFLGALALACKSVIPSIITHFINNFVVLTLGYLKVNNDIFILPLIIIGCIVLVFSAICLILKLRKEKTQKQEPKGFFFIPFGIIGVVVSLLVMVLGAI